MIAASCDTAGRKWGKVRVARFTYSNWLNLSRFRSGGVSAPVPSSLMTSFVAGDSGQASDAVGISSVLFPSAMD